MNNTVKFFLLLTIGVLVLSGCATVFPRRIDRAGSRSTYLDIEQFCRKYNFHYSYDTLDDLVKISSADTEIRLLLDSPVGYLNGGAIYLSSPPLYSKGRIFIPNEIARTVFSREVVAFKPSFAIKTIVIDPGHGGKDPGAVSRRGLREKDINLKVSKYLKTELTKRGFKVILTRERDTYLTLEQRVNVAKTHNADLFISIHANSNRARYVSGIEVYYLSSSRFDSGGRAVKLAKSKGGWNLSFSPKAILWDMLLSKNYGLSIETANTLHNNFKHLGFKVKPPRQGPFYVLRNAYVPAVLVEIGYLSNNYEEKILRKTYYQKQIAETIALGVVALKKRYSHTARR